MVGLIVRAALFDCAACLIFSVALVPLLLLWLGWCRSLPSGCEAEL
jgi:hypothetical protein